MGNARLDSPEPSDENADGRSQQNASPIPTPTARQHDLARLEWHNSAMRRLVDAVQELSLARSLEAVMAVVRRTARALTAADGATFVLREGDKCHYADEDAIAPLWKGQRFPMAACISGWTMLNRQPALIADIYADPRIPADAYRPTFVKSLVMVPIRMTAPIGAIGCYWAKEHLATPEETELVQALANTTAVAMENVRVYSELEARVQDRTAKLEAVHRELATRTQEELARQNTLLDLAKDAILVGDLEGRIRYWNKGAERLHGWTAEEVLGHRTTEFLYGNTDWKTDALSTVCEKGEWSGEIVKKTKSGLELLMEAHWTLVRDSEGRPKSILSISTDVTEKRRIQAQFLRAQRLESLGALAGGIAHDLNNVLAPILMSADLLEFTLTEKDLKPTAVHTIRQCAQRGSEMIKQILSFARGTGGKVCRLRVEQIVSDVAELVKATFPRTIQIILEIEPRLRDINGNPTQLHQVLMNLCVNARDAMPNGGDLTLAASATVLKDHLSQGELSPLSGEYAVLSVTDTGAGITPEVMDKIFVPFFTTKGEGKGTGLGLSSSVGIVKNHGGFLEVSSQVGKGTTFKVFLPTLSK